MINHWIILDFFGSLMKNAVFFQDGTNKIAACYGLAEEKGKLLVPCKSLGFTLVSASV